MSCPSQPSLRWGNTKFVIPVTALHLTLFSTTPCGEVRKKTRQPSQSFINTRSLLLVMAMATPANRHRKLSLPRSPAGHRLIPTIVCTCVLQPFCESSFLDFLCLDHRCAFYFEGPRRLEKSSYFPPVYPLDIPLSSRLRPVSVTFRGKTFSCWHVHARVIAGLTRLSSTHHGNPD